MAEYRHPSLEAREILDRLGNEVGHTTEAIESKGILLQVHRVVARGWFDPFCDNDDGVVMASTVPFPQGRDHIVDVVLVLRDDDVVGTAGDSRMCGYPPLRAAHDLDDDDPVVSLRGGCEAVDGVRCDLNGCLETEGDVRSGDVVVDRLGYANDVDALVSESHRRTQRAVPTDHDQSIDAVTFERRFAGCSAFAVDIWIHTRRAEDGSTASEDSSHRLAVESSCTVLHQPFPAVLDANNLHIVLYGPSDDTTDDRVESGAVSACGQNSYDAHGHAPRFSMSTTRSRTTQE